MTCNPSWLGSVDITQEAKHLALARPFGRQVAEAGHSHSVRKPSINGCLDEIGREEGERDRHVDLAYAAALAICDAFGIALRIGHEFIEPSASPRNRCDQESRGSRNG